MKIFDKVLLMIAGFSATAILLIFFTGELNSSSHKSNETFKEESIKTSNVSNDVVVYNKEIDNVIENYFQSIKRNPVEEEEVKRIIEDDDIPSVLENSDNKKTGILDDDTTDDMSISEDKELKEGIHPSKEIQKKSIKKKKNIQSQKKAHPYFYTIKHTIKTGESIWRIAQKYNVPIYTIVSANPSKARRIIQPGDKLIIPNRRGVFYKVRKKDYLSKIAKKFKVDYHKIKKANKINWKNLAVGRKIFIPGAKPLPKYKYVRKRKWVWPLSIHGRITSPFGWRRHPFTGKRQFHPGVDIAAHTGIRIRSVESGIVVFSGNGGTYGKLIIVRHKNHYLSIYAHCSRLLKRKGQYVKRGQVIARVGNTGLSTGPHIHFELKKKTKRLNPLRELYKTVKVRVKRSI